MNRVYKVIWSKAKHCYVVTSEVAKGYGKSAGSKGVKALLSGLVALSIAMGGYGMAGAVFVDSRNAEEGAYNTPVYTTEEVYTKEETGDKFATKDELNAKANAADVVNKTNAEVTFLTVSGDVEAHGNLKVGNGNFTVNGITGNVTTGNATIGDALIVKGDTEMKGDLGVKGNLFAGGYTETDAKAALNADGSIKGAEGKFTVGTDGKVTAAYGKIGTVDITSDGALTGMKSLGVENINAGGTITGNKLTDGVASLQAGNLNTTGNINAHDINAHDIVATGDISGKAISGTTITGTTITGTSLNTKGGDISGGAISGTTITGTTITGTSLNTQNGAIIGGAITGTTITATGKISTGGDVVSTGGKVQGTSISDGTATLSGGSLTGAVNITASGTITGNNVVVNEKLTTKNLEVTDGLKTDHITLGDETLNQTDINKGKVTSKIHEISGAVEYTAESSFNKDGSSITVRTDEGAVDSTGNSTVGSQIITQYLGNNAVPGGNNVTKRMIRNDNGTFSMVDTAVYGTKSSTVSQNADERKVLVEDGTKNLTVTENLTDGIVSETDDGAGQKVTLTQAMDGTYKVETSGTSTEEIGGQKIENYNGGLDTNITGDETHDVSGTMTTTVEGQATENYNGGLDTNITGDETHDVSGTMTTTVEGQATENYNNGLDTNITGDETHDVSGAMTTTVEGQATENFKNGLDTNITGDETHDVSGAMTTTVEGQVTENFKNGLDTNITGDETHDVSGAMTTTVEGQATENYNNGLDTNITGDETHDVSGAMTTTVEGQATENYNGGLDTNITGDETHDVSGTMTTTAKTVKTITGNNTVTSDNGGTTFANEDAKTPFEEGDETGTRVNTKITGNKVETGKVLTDFADVNNNLTVGGSTTLGRDGNTNLTVNSKSEFKDTVKMDSTLEVDGESTFNDKVTITDNGLDVTGGTTTDTLKVKETSEFGGKAAFKDDVSMDKKLTVKGAAEFKDDVSMGKNLTVTGKTETGTLHVNGDGYVGGDLNVEGNIETHDAELSENSRQVVTGRQLYQTNVRVDKLDNRIKKVGANAAALAALRPGDFNPDDKFSIAAGFGSYRNASAAALGLFYRPNENVLLSLGTSFGDGENMVNAGVSVKFGRGKSMAERRKEMADEVSSMRDEMRSQDERIAELEEMLKKQSELIEKLSKES